ncbi:MAG: AAA family ATPase [Actinomycetota bacterium]
MRLLIVSRHNAFRVGTWQAVEQVPGVDVVGVADSLDAAGDQLRFDQRIDAVLVHADAEEGDLVGDLRDLGLRFPLTSVIVACRTASERRMQAYLDAGARAVLDVPVTPADFETRVRGLIEWTDRFGERVQVIGRPQVGTAIALLGSKGGVGTTSLGVRLASAMATHRTVCLVDLDPFGGDAAVMLGLDVTATLGQLAPDADGRGLRNLEDVLLPVGDEFHALLTADPALPGPAPGAAAIRRMLGLLLSRFDLTIIDAGARLTAESLAAASFADQVAVVTEPTSLSIRNTNQLARSLQRANAIRPERLTAVLTKEGKRAQLRRRHVERVLDVTLADDAIPDDVTFCPAAERSAAAVLRGGRPTWAPALDGLRVQLFGPTALGAAASTDDGAPPRSVPPPPPAAPPIPPDHHPTVAAPSGGHLTIEAPPSARPPFTPPRSGSGSPVGNWPPPAMPRAGLVSSVTADPPWVR